MAGRVFIVGNGDVDNDVSKLIDSSDHVIRFNNCNNLGRNTGQRTTALWLCNTGRPGMRFADEATLRPLLARTSPSHIFLPSRPLHPLERFVAQVSARKSMREYGESILGTARRLSLDGRYADERYPRTVMETLREYGKPKTRPKRPSTGVIAIHYYVTQQEFREHEIHLTGFRFEGWKRHPWDHERAFVADLAAARRVKLHG